MNLNTEYIYLTTAPDPEPGTPASAGFVPWPIMRALPQRMLFITNSNRAAAFMAARALQTVVVAAQEVPLNATPDEERRIGQETSAKSIAINWKGRKVITVYDEKGEVSVEDFSSVVASIIKKGGAELANATDYTEEFLEFSEKAFNEMVVAPFNDPKTRDAFDKEQAYWAAALKIVEERGAHKGEMNINLVGRQWHQNLDGGDV
jgi:hypothetical protein